MRTWKHGLIRSIIKIKMLNLTEKEKECIDYTCFQIFWGSGNNKKLGNAAAKLMNLVKIKTEIGVSILSNYKEFIDIVLEELDRIEISKFQLNPKWSLEETEGAVRVYNLFICAYEALIRLKEEIK